jgi:polar amino acid transport system substrate-binding protein
MNPHTTPKIFLLITVFSLVFSFSAICQADDYLKVSFHEVPPWKMTMEDGSIGGIDIDFLREVAAKMKINITFDAYPIQRGFEMLKTGKVDIMTGVLRTPEREEFLVFIEPPYKTRSNKAFYVRKGEGHRLTCYEDLYHLKIGIRLGTKYFPRFDNDPALASQKEVLATDNPLHHFEKLIRKRVDVFMLTETTGNYRLHKYGYEDKVEKAPYSYNERLNVYLALSKKSAFAARIQEFNHHVKNLVKAGMMKKYERDFFAEMKKRHETEKK